MNEYDPIANWKREASLLALTRYSSSGVADEIMGTSILINQN